MSRSLIALTLSISLGIHAAAIAQGRPGLASIAKPSSVAQRTEQEWIVESVVKALASMTQVGLSGATEAAAVTAKLIPGPVAAPPTFTVTLGQSQVMQVRIDEHIWSSYTYTPLAAAMIQAAPARPAALLPTPDLNARQALVDPRVDALLGESERISSALTKDLRSAAAHEAAALLVGALALRESAGIFTDVRPALSRIAAHLSMSSALRQKAPEGLDGLLARAVTMTLVGRQKDALAILAAIEPIVTSAPDKAWIRALRLRNTETGARPPLRKRLESSVSSTDLR